MITRVGVVGSGLMGSGIAEVSARAGYEVEVYDITLEAALAGRARIDRSLDRAERSGKIDAEQRALAGQRLQVHSDLERLAGCHLVVEAATEDERVKLDIFRQLDRTVRRPDAILASNTSSIPIMKIAMVTERPESVIGLHFFNPVPVLRLVEIVPSLLTSEETEHRATKFVTEKLGKTTIRSQDRAGFIVNSLLVPYILAAIRMHDSGFASAEDIDNGMVLGCAHPMGPLRLADLIGLDTVAAIAEAMYEEFKEPLYSPVPLLLRMVEAGLLGKKSGRGFYSYGDRAAAASPAVPSRSGW
jgi:3-hydroxybutyryl-CoA dehydrogenase